MPNDELLDLTIAELAPRIASREVSPVEVTEAALARADRLQPSLNSFITLLHERALERAREMEAELAAGKNRGPLHGIPIGIKDNIETRGIRSTVGSLVLADNVPDEDARVVTLCEEAGAIILGKENLEEFAAGATSNNPTTAPSTTPGTWTTSPAVPAAAAGPTWPPALPSRRWAPTWAARYACPVPSAAWWASSRPLVGSARGV